jgi:hypothetical protein
VDGDGTDRGAGVAGGLAAGLLVECNVKYPQMKCRMIPTLERHYEAFGYKHPLEMSVVLGAEAVESGLLVHGIEMREIFRMDHGMGKMSVDVTGLKRALNRRAIPLVMQEATLNKRFVEYTVQSNGCEEEGIARLKPADLERPGILMAYKGAVNVFVDGAHRMVRRWREGMTTFEFAFVPFNEDTLRYVSRPEDEGKFYGNEDA